MKPVYLFCAVVIMIALLLTAFRTFDKKDLTIHPKQTDGFAVVELFTSEGCSSCPSADEAIARLRAKELKNVYVLSYHVDYWNRLGWIDSFSMPEFTTRQRQYASHFSLESIYTPQVIVNGQSQFVGSNESKLLATVKTETLNKKNASGLEIDAIKIDKNISVSYKIISSENILLHLALVQPKAETTVKKGENSGRILQHVSVVRHLKTVDAKGNGVATIIIPQKLVHLPLQLVAFTQSKKTFQILGADIKKF